jgi:hypothetical protein
MVKLNRRRTPKATEAPIVSDAEDSVDGDGGGEPSTGTFVARIIVTEGAVCNVEPSHETALDMTLDLEDCSAGSTEGGNELVIVTNAALETDSNEDDDAAIEEKAKPYPKEGRLSRDSVLKVTAVVLLLVLTVTIAIVVGLRTGAQSEEPSLTKDASALGVLQTLAPSAENTSWSASWMPQNSTHVDMINASSTEDVKTPKNDTHYDVVQGNSTIVETTIIPSTKPSVVSSPLPSPSLPPSLAPSNTARESRTVAPSVPVSESRPKETGVGLSPIVAPTSNPTVSPQGFVNIQLETNRTGTKGPAPPVFSFGTGESHGLVMNATQSP